MRQSNPKISNNFCKFLNFMFLSCNPLMIEKYNFSVVDIYIILLFYGINAEAVIYHLSLNLISFSEYPVSLDNCSVVVFQFSKIISFGTSNSIANLSASVS